MGRLLLTSGQVSMVFSVTIIFLFTLALFLSGYALQQRYVHTLQAAIKPRLPKPLPAAKPILPPTLDVKWARPIGARPDVDETVDQLLARETLDWSRLAYVQVVKEFAELCSAVMLLADLQKLRSPAKRVLMFPRVWLKEGNNDDEYDPHISTTMRLLRTAARRHGVTLVPMETIIDGADELLASSYSLASLYSLTNFERVVYLEGPGVLLDASALDSLLAFSKSEPMAAFPATPERTAMSTSLLLVHPSHESFQELKEKRSLQPQSDLDLFRQTFAAPQSLISEWSLSMGNVVYESQHLRDAADGFNLTAFEGETTYVRLSDPELPGPEYDVPYADRVRIRPNDEQAREAWEKLYERFRQRRMEVCGLDLEYWERSASAESEAHDKGDATDDRHEGTAMEA